VFWVISVYFNIKEHSPEVVILTRGTLCVYIYIYIYRERERERDSTNIPPIMRINRIYETQNILSL